MRISGPERYRLTFDSDAFTVECQKGTPKFSGIATSKKPKLYVVSIDNRPVYVGVTKQPIRNRLRLGWNATGEGGYYGYAWRHHHTEANIDIWCHEDPPLENPVLDIETIEAEVVFLSGVLDSGHHIRPRFIFIHRHQSTVELPHPSWRGTLDAA